MLLIRSSRAWSLVQARWHAPSGAEVAEEGSAKSAAWRIEYPKLCDPPPICFTSCSNPPHPFPTYEASEESSSQDLYDKKYVIGPGAMPLVISSLDEHVERGLRSVPHPNRSPATLQHAKLSA
ncbi:hypothetical protein DH2020_024706 [Rehmannia glutinosa]|uniref:Uncharacterized protein n=1 Tax=Rehmannia glutinosa TaxID=99300 RepID=A0ABR0W5V0_REHGL